MRKVSLPVGSGSDCGLPVRLCLDRICWVGDRLNMAVSVTVSGSEPNHPLRCTHDVLVDTPSCLSSSCSRAKGGDRAAYEPPLRPESPSAAARLVMAGLVSSSAVICRLGRRQMVGVLQAFQKPSDNPPIIPTHFSDMLSQRFID